jgi:hypothetical protein
MQYKISKDASRPSCQGAEAIQLRLEQTFSGLERHWTQKCGKNVQGRCATCCLLEVHWQSA